MKAPSSLVSSSVAALLVHAVAAKPINGSKCGLPLVQDQALQDSVTIEALMAHAQALEDIAYATPGRNRLIGTGGHNGTVQYIVDQLEALGDYYTIELQPFVTAVELSSSATLSINGVEYETGAMEFTNNGTLNDVPIVPISEVGCDPSNFPVDMEGKIALISRGTCNFSLKAFYAAQAGAVGAIIYNNIPGLLSGTLSGQNDSYAPAISVSMEDGLALVALYESGEELLANMDVWSYQSVAHTNNVIATSKYGDEANVLFLGAHSDSVVDGPGINDDGSGSSGILEVAIQLAKWKTKSKVKFAWWTAEEEGLLGSYHYVETASAEELAKIRLYLNFDMIASPNYKLGIYDGDGSQFNLSGPAGSDTVEHLYEAWFEEKGLNYTGSEFNGRSDYGGFLDFNIPCGGLDAGADDIKTEEDVEKWGGVAGEQCDQNYHSALDNVDNLAQDAFEIMAKGIAHAVGVYGRSFDGFPERETASTKRSVENWATQFKYKGPKAIM